MNGPSRQGGITFISLIVMFVVVGFFMLLLMKLGPVYLENYSVKTVLENVKKEPFLASQPPRKIRSQVSNRLYVNEVRRIADKDIKLKRVDGKVTIKIDYEVRKNILGNVDAIMTFSESAELRPN